MDEAEEILGSLHKQVERLNLQPMSPVEAGLVNALACLIALLLHDRKATREPIITAKMSENGIG